MTTERLSGHNSGKWPDGWLSSSDNLPVNTDLRPELSTELLKAGREKRGILDRIETRRKIYMLLQ